jgi:hypothetical protein
MTAHHALQSGQKNTAEGNFLLRRLQPGVDPHVYPETLKKFGKHLA